MAAPGSACNSALTPEEWTPLCVGQPERNHPVVEGLATGAANKTSAHLLQLCRLHLAGHCSPPHQGVEVGLRMRQ